MITFLKAQASSLTATLVDFVVTILLARAVGTDIVIASAAGTISGGVVNFLMGRNWVFSAANGRMRKQALRYILVWNGNLALNTGGVYMASHLLHLTDILAKVSVSLIVGFTYNYFLQKKYVFR